MKRYILTLVLLLASSPVQAGPFCVVRSDGQDCSFFGQSDCAEAARVRGGVCTVNRDELKVPSSGMPYCVVTAYRTQCWYSDEATCRGEASRFNGICLPNPNR